MSDKAGARPLCVCGDTWAQHQASNEGCWGRKCLRLPVAARCQAYAPPKPRVTGPGPGQGALVFDEAAPVDDAPSLLAERKASLRAGTFRRSVYELVERAALAGMTVPEIRVVTGRSDDAVVDVVGALAADGLLIDSGQSRAQATVWNAPR